MKDQLLPQRAYTAIMKHFIKTGFALHYSELGLKTASGKMNLPRLACRVVKAGSKN